MFVNTLTMLRLWSRLIMTLLLPGSYMLPTGHKTSQEKHFILLKWKSKWSWLFLIWLSNFLKCASNTWPQILLSLIIGSTSLFPCCLRLRANFSFKAIRRQPLFVTSPGCDTHRRQNQCKELNLSVGSSALLLSSYLGDRLPCMWLCSRKLTESPSLEPSTWYTLSMTTGNWTVGI